jgi:hypothetical protein
MSVKNILIAAALLGAGFYIGHRMADGGGWNMRGDG